MEGNGIFQSMGMCIFSRNTPSREMLLYGNVMLRSNAFLQHLDLSGSPVDSRCCDLISDLENLRVLRLENCPGVDTAAVVSVLARRRKTLVQFECGNKLQG